MMTVRRPADEEQLTAPVEDYLKAIYELERGGEAAGTTEIAERLGFAAASVSGMMRRLADAGLVTHEKYHGVRLTTAGRRAALRTIRRHRVIETYLTRALGYAWDRVHEEAERLEHAASDELIDRMAAAIGEPTVDPHGAPIPTREGGVDTTSHRSLAELSAGDRATVVQVSDDDGSMLRYLERLGLIPGADLEVVSRAPFDGPISVRVGSRTHGIGVSLAAQVRVAAKGRKKRGQGSGFRVQ